MDSIKGETMKQMICEMCGGKDLIKQDSVFVCQSCQAKYSVEEAKKMMVETDTPAKNENALKNARKAMENKNYEQAEECYKTVLMEEPDNWEANFYSIYCKAMTSNISQAAYYVKNCIKTVLKDIKKLDETIQQNEAIKQINTDLSTLATLGYNNAINFYNSKMTIYGNNSFFASAVSNAKLDCANDILPFTEMLIFFGKELVSEFGGNEFTNSINVQCYEDALKIVNDLYKSTDDRFFDSNSVDFLQKYTDELKKIKPSSKILNISENKSSPSFDLGSFTTPEKTEKPFLTKPLAPNGCGCGCVPAAFTSPIFIIIFVVLIIIVAIITPEESQTQSENISSEEQVIKKLELIEPYGANFLNHARGCNILKAVKAYPNNPRAIAAFNHMIAMINNEMPMEKRKELVEDLKKSEYYGNCGQGRLLK